MRLTVGSIALGFGIASIACSKSAPEAGKPVAIDRVCEGEDGSRVRLTGYVRHRRGLMSFCSTFGGKETCDLALYATAEAPAEFDLMRPRKGPEPVNARLSVPVGQQPGEMARLPEKFKDSDVKVHLAGGGTAGEGGHVTIDGKLSVVPGDPSAKAAPKSCFVNVDWAITP